MNELELSESDRARLRSEQVRCEAARIREMIRDRLEGVQARVLRLTRAQEIRAEVPAAPDLEWIENEARLIASHVRTLEVLTSLPRG